MFDRHRLAALATAITAIHAGHIEYSRIAGLMDAWFFGYLALLLVVDGLRAPTNDLTGPDGCPGGPVLADLPGEPDPGSLRSWPSSWCTLTFTVALVE